MADIRKPKETSHSIEGSSRKSFGLREMVRAQEKASMQSTLRHQETVENEEMCRHEYKLLSPHFQRLKEYIDSEEDIDIYKDYGNILLFKDQTRDSVETLCRSDPSNLQMESLKAIQSLKKELGEFREQVPIAADLAEILDSMGQELNTDLVQDIQQQGKRLIHSIDAEKEHFDPNSLQISFLEKIQTYIEYIAKGSDLDKSSSVNVLQHFCRSYKETDDNPLNNYIIKVAIPKIENFLGSITNLHSEGQSSSGPSSGFDPEIIASWDRSLRDGTLLQIEEDEPKNQYVDESFSTHHDTNQNRVYDSSGEVSHRIVPIKHKKGYDHPNPKLRFRIARITELTEPERNEPGFHFTFGEIQVHAPSELKEISGNDYPYRQTLVDLLGEHSRVSDAAMTNFVAGVIKGYRKSALKQVGEWSLNTIT